ncbi:flagellar brake protein [Yersinia intermedia]|uniref:Flagellar brake protein YcgR n=1 Tax=Yersinia intermedia TaxID=631 RepID=A0A209A1A0_YERIN|nr:flagellar brake protein [Yersinia intermedia]MCB5313562.1 flagellar brake protein [Yersinia intermedia]MCB5324453.1 flagellar brake protein [Yersinia intermedia]MCB5328789.1 flagellar brake protein [Yersinia intermedia]OVZ86458.1 flagellar brake protein [Yersinia intermedia]UNK22541.1 flagellar brake protein [Yersinia intermedia]
MSETSKENFVKTNKLAICAILRDLKKNDTAVMVIHARGQFISRILDVVPETNQFIFDFGSVEHENTLALAANQLTIIAEPTGAKIEFTFNQLKSIKYLSLPAFSAAIPEQLYFIQRREYFRVNIPQWPPYYCSGKFSDGSKFSYMLGDISLGGMGLYAVKGSEFPLQECGILQDVSVDLGGFGVFKLDLQFIRAIDKQVVNNKGETLTVQRLSFKFPRLSPMQEKGLQRAIFELEKQQTAKVRKFQDNL